jgi:hypothetical protein
MTTYTTLGPGDIYEAQTAREEADEARQEREAEREVDECDDERGFYRSCWNRDDL